mmetsp:Transcript_16585/g.45945  ORF Transcript_16585/g.45945 Transcript_16585/m.45945 type:complete len:286 (+) Transcript_16585:1399-2256(+)
MYSRERESSRTQRAGLLHLASGSPRSVLLPGSSTNAADAWCLADVWEVVHTNGIQTKLSDIGTCDATGLTINDVDDAGWWLHGQSSWTHDAVIQPAAGDGCLLVVLVGEDLLHGGPHEDLEEEGCLVLRIAGTDGGDDRQALDIVLLHAFDDVVGTIREHGLTDILRLSTKRDDDTVDLTCLEDLLHIGLFGDIPPDHGQCGCLEWLSGLGATGSSWHDEIGWVSCQSNDVVSLLHGLVDTFGGSQSRGTEHGDCEGIGRSHDRQDGCNSEEHHGGVLEFELCKV